MPTAALPTPTVAPPVASSAHHRRHTPPTAALPAPPPPPSATSAAPVGIPPALWAPITAVTTPLPQVQAVPTWNSQSTLGLVMPMAHVTSSRRPRVPGGKAIKVAGVVALLALAVAGGSFATRQNLLPGGTVYDNHQVAKARTAGYDTGHSDGDDVGHSSGYDQAKTAG